MNKSAKTWISRGQGENQIRGFSTSLKKHLEGTKRKENWKWKTDYRFFQAISKWLCSLSTRLHSFKKITYLALKSFFSVNKHEITRAREKKGNSRCARPRLWTRLIKKCQTSSFDEFFLIRQIVWFSIMHFQYFCMIEHVVYYVLLLYTMYIAKRNECASTISFEIVPQNSCFSMWTSIITTIIIISQYSNIT